MRGRLGLKVRRGLATADPQEADRLVAQLNEILRDESWWAIDRRAEAEQKFNGAIVAAFFDDLEANPTSSRQLRERFIPLPGAADDGYARAMLVGLTGAGKTTLLRQLIGSDHRRDRFPSTSTARTTTAEIEIITGEPPYEAAVTFLSQQEVRGLVDECVNEASLAAVRELDDHAVTAALLEHPEQRFRLSYPLGTWEQKVPEAPREPTEESQFAFEDDPSRESPEDDNPLAGHERVSISQVETNNRYLRDLVASVRELADSAGSATAARRGDRNAAGGADQRQEWDDAFLDALAGQEGYSEISLDIVDAIMMRFDLIKQGKFDRDASGWPLVWHYKDDDRDRFLEEVRWFTANHGQQFGRLLTPVVDGIRVTGPFSPTHASLSVDHLRLVLLDGEGLGHSAKEATSISTRITERFRDVDLILLVDNAQSPLQAAPLELIRSAGTNGHGGKLAAAFTHFDLVKGDSLLSQKDKREHVDKTIKNALAGLRESLGPAVTQVVEQRLNGNKFYLGGLDRPIRKIPPGFVEEIRRVLDVMQQSSARVSDDIDAGPIYDLARLDLYLRDAADGFKRPWLARLGIEFDNATEKVHWARIKALTRRIANRWRDWYGDLKPKADFISHIQTCLSRWLDVPKGWTREPRTEAEGKEKINEIRREVSERVHALATRRLVESHLPAWRSAYLCSGPGSTWERATEMKGIYDAAAPSISSLLDRHGKDFRSEIIALVGDAVRRAGGSLVGD